LEEKGVMLGSSLLKKNITINFSLKKSKVDNDVAILACRVIVGSTRSV
jgi:hypothetical protein